MTERKTPIIQLESGPFYNSLHKELDFYHKGSFDGKIISKERAFEYAHPFFLKGDVTIIRFKACSGPHDGKKIEKLTGVVEWQGTTEEARVKKEPCETFYHVQGLTTHDDVLNLKRYLDEFIEKVDSMTIYTTLKEDKI